MPAGYLAARSNNWHVMGTEHGKAEEILASLNLRDLEQTPPWNETPRWYKPARKSEFRKGRQSRLGSIPIRNSDTSPIKLV